MCFTVYTHPQHIRPVSCLYVSRDASVWHMIRTILQASRTFGGCSYGRRKTTAHETSIEWLVREEEGVCRDVQAPSVVSADGGDTKSEQLLLREQLLPSSVSDQHIAGLWRLPVNGNRRNIVGRHEGA